MATTSGQSLAAVTRSREQMMLLTFRIERELFALPVEQIQEILDPIELTDVPHAPSHAPSLVNVRGVIVPFFDLRERLRIRSRTSSDYRIVAVEAVVNGAATRLAVAADSVEAVIEISSDALDPLPPLGSRWPEEFIRGVTHVGDSLIVLLDNEVLFNTKAPVRAA
jgi:purine-binding chemotaxis protein CheW